MRLGGTSMLRRFNQQRFADTAVRMLGISALNGASMASPQPLRDARAAGLMALHGFAPLRRSLMKLGLGEGS